MLHWLNLKLKVKEACNGTAGQPERKILRLSDTFGGEGDIEVIVTMLNVNYGKNRALMEAY